MKTIDHLQQAFKDGHIQLITTGKTEKVRYVAVNLSEKWSDAEEKVALLNFKWVAGREG